MKSFFYNYQKLIFIFCTILVISLIIFLFTYRTSSYIQVDDKYWVYYSAIKYDTHHTETTCSGTGSKRKCSTSIKTISHIRCFSQKQGYELPPIAPELSCIKWIGDYDYNNVTYYLVFHKVGENGSYTKTFPGNLWSNFGIGVNRKVSQDILGNIWGLENE